MNIQMKTAKAKQVLYKAIEDIFPKSFPFFWPVFYCSDGNETSCFPVSLWGIACLLFLEFKHYHIFTINLMSIPQCYSGLCSTLKRLFKLYSVNSTDTMSIHRFVPNKFFAGFKPEDVLLYCNRCSLYYYFTMAMQNPNHQRLQLLWSLLYFQKDMRIHVHLIETGAFQVVLVVKNLPANAEGLKEAGSIPGSGRSPRGGNASHFSILV